MFAAQDRLDEGDEGKEDGHLWEEREEEEGDGSSQCRNRYLDGTEILLIPISKKY